MSDYDAYNLGMGEPVMRAYEPTWRDILAGWMMGDKKPSPERRAIVEGLTGSSGLGSKGMGLVDLTPAGIPMSVQEARNAAQSGDPLGATLNAMAVIPAAKLPARMVKGAVSGAGDDVARAIGTDPWWHGIFKNKLPMPIDEMSATRVPKGDLLPRQIADLQSMQGGAIIPALGDRTQAGTMLTHINGKQLAQPVDMQGGADFMRSMAGKSPEHTAWASEKGVITGLSNKAKQAAEQGRDPYLVYTAMSNRAGDYSHMMTDALLAQLPDAKIPKKAVKEFDTVMKETHSPNWPGVMDEGLRDFLLKGRSLRTRFAEEMARPKFQNAGFPDVASTRFAITEPELLNVPSGSTGYAISKLDPSGAIISKPSVPHTTYNTQLAGSGYVGGLEAPVPKDVMFSTWAKGQDPKLMANSAKADYKFKMDNPMQIADQEWLDGIIGYLQGISR